MARVSPPTSAPGAAREPLRARVVRELRQRILHADVAPGDRITETRLAEELDVSRTPVREALQQLATEGFLTGSLGRGYAVAPLSSREVGELFAVIAALECQALEWGGTPGTDQLAALTEINARLAALGDDAEAAMAINGEWHRALVRHCPNGELRRIIEENRRRVYRYEYYYFLADPAHIQVSVRLHRAILEPLRAGDLAAAAGAVHAHWLTDLDLMLPAILDAAR